MSESEVESEIVEVIAAFTHACTIQNNMIVELETRVIALERGLEAILRRLEESGQAEDEAGWFGRPE